MASQSRLRQTAAPEFTPASTQTVVQKRPFAPPTKTDISPTLADIQAQLDHAQRFGHHLANFATAQPQPGAPIIQPKLTIGAPGDKYEQEADRVAQQVVQRLQSPEMESLQAQPSVQRETMPEEEELQMKPLAAQIQREEIPEEEELQMKPMLQRQSGGGEIAADAALETAIQQSRGQGSTLADSIRRPMEHAFGHVDFSGVKVHTDAQSNQLNRSIQAKAFTTGQDIFFRQAAYQPASQAGQQLLAHELTHVVQQNDNTLRRFVDFSGNLVTAAWLLNRLKAKEGQLYTEAQAFMDDNALQNFFQPSINDPNQIFVSQVFESLKQHIEQQKAQGAFAPSLTEQGVEVELKQARNNLPSQLNVTTTADSVDLHPAASLFFQGDLAVRMPNPQLNQWTFGMTQTLFSAHRRLRLVSQRGARTITVDVANPCVDHRQASTAPWYDVTSNWTPNQNFSIGSVYLDDRPGYTIPKAPAETVLDSQGQDIFKTWIIMQDAAGATTRYLYEWAWNLTYQPGGGATPAGAATAQTTGQGAVLGGGRASDIKVVGENTSLTWDLPYLAEYKAMKKAGKAMFTPGSGMMPVKEYATLQQKFVTCMNRQDLNQALATLTQIKQNLDRMDQAKGYWKDAATKAQSFNPFYTRVNQALVNLQTLMSTP